MTETTTDLSKHGATTGDSGKLIAALPFGFWTALTSQRYQGGLVKPGIVSPVSLWPRPLMLAFPHSPPGTTRRQVAGRFHSIRLLRNRVFHHQAIWAGMPGPGGVISPKRQNWEILDALNWMNPEIAAIAQELTQIETIYDAGTTPWKRKLEAFIGRKGWNI